MSRSIESEGILTFDPSGLPVPFLNPPGIAFLAMAAGDNRERTGMVFNTAWAEMSDHENPKTIQS